MIQADAIDAILASMPFQRRQPATQADACKTLAALRQGFLPTKREATVIHIVKEMQCLLVEVVDVEAEEGALRVIQAFCSGMDWITLSNLGLCEAVLGAMQARPEDDSIQEIGQSILDSLASAKKKANLYLFAIPEHEVRSLLPTMPQSML
jgi:hypothetical protein